MHTTEIQFPWCAVSNQQIWCSVLNPLISVIVPVYNAERWLSATLDSILAQTWPRVEVIVVDDGSTDSSFQLANSYARHSIALHRKENGGPCSARNLGLAKAQGDYIQFLDSDDVLHPDKLRLQLMAIANGPSRCAATCRYAMFRDDIDDAIFYQDKLWATQAPIDWLINAWSNQCAMPTLAWLCSRQAVDAAGIWNSDIALNNDGEFFARLILHCEEVNFVPDSIAFYRVGNPDSVSSARGRRALESLHLGARLCRGYLLGTEDSERTRAACAALLGGVARAAFPSQPDIASAAEADASALSGVGLHFESRALHQIAERIIGWRGVARLRALRASLAKTN